MEIEVNHLVKAKDCGPVFVINGNKIEVHNIQGIDDDAYGKLTADQQSQYHRISSVNGDCGYNKELTPPVVVDKPENQGLLLKPGQKVSADFPSEYALAAAFKAGDMLDKDWIAANPEQDYLIKSLRPAAAELPSIPEGIIAGKACKGDPAPINDFFKAHGLDMRIDKLGPGDVAIAGTLSLQGAWQGESTKMTVVQLYKKGGVTVYAALAGDDKLTSFQVTARAAELTPSPTAPRADYESVLIPKVDKNVSSDLTGLIGMRATDGSQVSQAKMQTKLAVDEKGFKAEQGVSIMISRGMTPPSFKLDKPFIMWAVADGCLQPIFATEVDQRYWKDPKH